MTDVKMDMAIELWSAWRNQEFTLAYQPQMNILTGSIERFEALIRWQKAGKYISPEVFVPLLEQIGLIVPVGTWVLKKVCEQLKEWETACPEFCGVSVNFSALQFREPNIVETIMGVIDQSGVCPSKVEIELTEGVLLEEPSRMLTLFHHLKSLGIKIAIDDFGTGYSSLSYLDQIPFDTIKLDSSFINKLQDNGRGSIITKAIIALVRELKARLVVEGVEYEHQMEFLKQQGCDAIQGYLFCKPIAADEALRLFVNHQLRQESSERLECKQ